MIEPDAPTTIWIKQPTYPAFLLASDEGRPLKPSSVILRHRHLCRQQRIVQSSIPSGETPGGWPVCRAVEAAVAERSGGPGPSTASASSAYPGPPSSVEDDTRSAVSPPSESASDRTTFLGAAESRSPSERASATHPPSLFSARSKTVETSIGPLVVTHQERALRARGNKPHIRHEKTAWYFSSSNRLLDTPPALPEVSLGELYVHEGPDKQKQVWVWSKTSSWSSLQVAAPHPYLSDYILNFCSNGEPSWVTKETLRTYIGRTRKREAEAD